MQRFFIAPELLQQSTVILPQPITRQLVQVLRARMGDHIILLDGTGTEYEAELTAVSPRQVRTVILQKSTPQRESRIRMVLYQALLRESKMDWVLQKGTELGAASLVPVLCERSLSDTPGAAKYERWRRIITEAAEQSGRTRLPVLSPPILFKDACEAPMQVKLLAAPDQALSLAQSLSEKDSEEVGIFIGPEGGFSEVEIERARSQGVHPFRMGRRILRTETAGLVALALIQAFYGEL